MTHSEIVNFLWEAADFIRDFFKRGKYQDVILPLTVLRRLDCVLAPTKEEVLKRKAKLSKSGLRNLDDQLNAASGFAFYNTSRFDFGLLLGDAPQAAANLRNYIAGFSSNMREVIGHFDFDNTISKLDEAGLLFQVLEHFGSVDLHPDRIDNPTMGMIFEELIRRFNEALDENPGEHFTPRDVVHLMVDLMLSGDEEKVARKGAVQTIYDPCCGSGGLLMIAKEHIVQGVREGEKQPVRPPINPYAEVYLFGQEVNPETWAISKSDFFMKDPSGRDANNIAFGSTLSRDRHADATFDYLIANPPYGKKWRADEEAVRSEHERGEAGRFAPGLPRISDGQTLFLLHMLKKARSPDQGGARIAIIMNGSPLFTGDAGSGESEIRRFVMENDHLEALIALPEQLFYNTGIATYIWLLTNRKAPGREGKVLLVDATSFWTSMPKSLGEKRREIPHERARDILKLVEGFKDGEVREIEAEGEREEKVVSRVFPVAQFGYRKITVERPLRLNFQANPERLSRLEDQKAFQNLVQSKRRGKAKGEEEAQGRERQQEIRSLLDSLGITVCKDRSEFLEVLDARAGEAKMKLSGALKKAIIAALCERDESAEICRDAQGDPEPDPDLRDTERVPLPEGEDAADENGVPASVQEFFAREVTPHVPDAWIDVSKCDPKDGKVGVIGYEINFNRYFYRPVSPRPLSEIRADIKVAEREIMEMLSALDSEI